jgi:octaprenyl-diphosphate synthase
MTGYIETASKIAGSEIADALARDIRACEDELRAHLQSGIDSVDAIGAHVLESGGKRLRPALVSLCARAIDNDAPRDRIARISACVEMVHMATLIHDDVIDEAEMRRGKPTARNVWGSTKSVLAGDVLLSKAMQILARDGDLRIIDAVSDAVVDLAEGEVWELELRGNFALDADTHLSVLRMKTATFIGCCCKVGGMISGGDEAALAALERFGIAAGMAFQIADDLLDYRGDQSNTGKVQGGDFREGCATLPVILLRDQLSREEEERMRSEFGNGVSDADLAEFCGWMRERGSFAASERRAQAFVEDAERELASLPESDAKHLLGSIATFFAARQA